MCAGRAGRWGPFEAKFTRAGPRFTWSRRKLARCDRFGENHRRRLKGLLFILGVAAVRAILYGQHAERIARAKNWDSQERMVDSLPRLRTEREGWMLLRVREIEGPGVAGDQSDKPFIRA